MGRLFSISLLGLAMLGIGGSGVVMADEEHSEEKVEVKLLLPQKGDRVGIGGKHWVMDILLKFDGMIEKTGFTSVQLTGPAGHNDVPPFAGTFSPGVDDRLPGLIVLLSTTTAGAGVCQNIANLFNLTGINEKTDRHVEILDTWLVGAPLFGQGKTEALIAVADDKNGDGIYNDAPAVLPDVNGDGVCNKRDLKAFGVASNIVKTRFYINQ